MMDSRLDPGKTNLSGYRTGVVDVSLLKILLEVFILSLFFSAIRLVISFLALFIYSLATEIGKSTVIGSSTYMVLWLLSDGYLILSRLVLGYSTLPIISCWNSPTYLSLNMIIHF